MLSTCRDAEGSQTPCIAELIFRCGAAIYGNVEGCKASSLGMRRTHCFSETMDANSTLQCMELEGDSFCSAASKNANQVRAVRAKLGQTEKPST